MSIPRELRECPQWVLYRVQGRKGKQTKVPYQIAHATRRASSTDPETWGTFASALAARERGLGDGIGFVFSEADPFAGVDLDACVHDGQLDERARPVVERLNSYTELSPSGTGLHVIGRAQVGDGRRTNTTPWEGKFEAYDRARFFTMTGAVVAGLPTALVDMSDGLAVVRDELMPEPRALTLVNGAGPNVELSDHELLRRAMNAKNGDKFRALWSGDRSGYGSESEADQALCSMLAFWTGPDPPRIDRLFQSSGLMREKWDRESYRVPTIERALQRTQFYKPRVGLPKVTTREDALSVATAAIQMTDVPLVSATEWRDGQIVLERADDLQLYAPSLESLTKFAGLQGKLVAYWGHELTVAQEDKTATAHRFVAALRRHLGASPTDLQQETVDSWFGELASLAGEVKFEGGDAETRLRAWQILREVDPGAERSTEAFARKVIVAHNVLNGDRYLRSSWAQEYMRRCGWRGSADGAVALLEAIGFAQPNPASGGQVRARWRKGGQTVVMRFWVTDGERWEHWQA